MVSKGWRRGFDELGRRDFAAAARAAVALCVPLVVLTAVGRTDLSVYAAFGAFTALYGRNEPYRARLVTLSVAAISLWATICGGIALAVTDPPQWVVGLALAVTVMFGIATSEVMNWVPRGSIFFVFALMVMANQSLEAAGAPEAVAVAAATAGFSILLGMSGWLLRRVLPQHQGELFLWPLQRRPVRALSPVRTRTYWYLAGINVIGIVGAWIIALAFGVGHPYWASVAVAAVMPTLAALTGYARMWHRFVGTAAGVVVAAVLFVWGPPIWLMVAILTLCSFGAEMFVARRYDIALLFITPLALGTANLAERRDWYPLFVDRFVETGLGVALAFVIVFAARRVVLREPPSAG